MERRRADGQTTFRKRGEVRGGLFVVLLPRLYCVDDGVDQER